MAIENILMRKMAREIQEWIYLGIEDGMIRSASEYLNLIGQGRTVEAENMLSRAVDMPFRASARIEELERVYTTAYISNCLALYGDATLSELKADIKKKEDNSKKWVDQFIDSGINKNVIANNIISNTESNYKKWVAPIPASYIGAVDKAKKV